MDARPETPHPLEEEIGRLNGEIVRLNGRVHELEGQLREKAREAGDLWDRLQETRHGRTVAPYPGR